MSETKNTTALPAGATCTISIASRPTGKCADPAVTGFETDEGERFFECETHAIPSAPRGRLTLPSFSSRVAPSDTVAVGDVVRVAHAGLVKIGTVTAVRRTRLTVLVPNRDSKKEIDRAIADIEVVR